MTIFKYSNNAETYVSTQLEAGATSLDVTDGSMFPSEFPFRLTIWDINNYTSPADDPNMEIVEVTNRVDNTLTIIRAQESTSDVVHPVGTKVALLITAGTFDRIQEEFTSISDDLSTHESNADAHHSEIHTLDSHDTSVTGAELDADHVKLASIEDGATADQIASEVPFTPTGDISADNVQSAIEELDNEKETPIGAQSKVDDHAALTSTHGISGDIVGTSDTQTLTNKTIKDTSNVIYADTVYVCVTNNTGVTLTAGTPVYVSGYNIGNNCAEVSPCDNSSSATMPCFGIVSEDIPHGSSGMVVATGVIESVDTSAYSVGDDLYVGTNGTLTSTKPTGTALIQKVALVIRSNANTGAIQVFGAGRVNDVPNLANGKVWVGNASGVPTETSFAASEMSYDNTTSGLTATDVQAAVDEIDDNLDTHIAATSTHGVGVHYLSKTSKSSQIPEFAATAVVTKSGVADFVCSDYVTDDACIQAAIDYVPAHSVIVVKGDMTITSPITFLKPLTLVHYGNITASDTLFIIGDGSGSVESGAIHVYGEVSGPDDSGTACFKMISGRYWDLFINKVDGFDILWEFAPVAQQSSVWYAGNKLVTDACPVSHVWYIPVEPDNVYIEGNILQTKGLSHANQPILFEGGFGNILFGFTHSKNPTPVAEIDDSTSRGSNVFYLHYSNYAAEMNIHQNSVLVSPKRSIIPNLELQGYSCANLLPNSSFEKFDGDIPVGFTYSGSSISKETSIVKHGNASVKIISETDKPAYCAYTPPVSERTYLEGKTVTLSSWIYATESDRARCAIYYDDGSGLKEALSSFHPGDGEWHRLSISVTLGTGLTELFYRPIVVTSGTSCTTYVDAAMFSEHYTMTDYTPNHGDVVIGYKAVGNFTAPTVPASGTNYINNFGYHCQVQVYGGTVSDIAIDGVATGLTSGVFIIPPSGTINITYTDAPSWRWWGL